MQNNRIAGETNNQILALKAKHEEEKERFEVEIKKLQDQLKERDNSIEFDDKSFKIGEDQKGQGKANKEEFANPIKILMNRLQKIKAVNKKKKMLIDQYVKNAQILEQVFSKIKEHSGISKLDEIVTTYIKAEEQNYSLYNYVNMLNQENDAYEDNNHQLDTEIETYQELAKMSNDEKQKKIRNLQEEKQSIIDQKQKMEDEGDEIQVEFNSIKDVVETMIEQFNDAKFNSCVSTKMKYDEETQFNEGNIVIYLSELEEYISYFTQYVANKRGDPHPAIAGVPLERLNNKNFISKELQIEAPIDHEILTEASNVINEDREAH